MGRASNRRSGSLFLDAQHQLRQPLNAISLLIGELRDATDGRDRAAIVEDMRYALQLSNAWLDALTDLEKAEQGHLHVQLQAVPLHPVFARLEEEFSAPFAERGLQLRVVDSHAVARTDPAVLRRVLALLLDNAGKFTRQGKILLGCRRAGKRLRVEVWDNGLGIAEADREKLFEPFFRLENEVRPRERGLGLGLTYARRLADLTGDEIAVRSQLGKGSCFALILTAAPDDGQPAQVVRKEVQSSDAEQRSQTSPGILETTAGPLPSAMSADPLDGARVLVMTENDAEVLRSSLELWGAEVRQVSPEDLAGDLPAPASLLIAEAADFGAGRALRNLLSRHDQLSVILLADSMAAPKGSGEPRVHVLQRPVRPARLRSLCHFALTHG